MTEPTQAEPAQAEPKNVATSRAPSAGSSSGGAVYALGFFGAAIFYWQHAHGFWPHVVGVLKAILWPAYLVYGLLGHLAG